MRLVLAVAAFTLLAAATAVWVRAVGQARPDDGAGRIDGGHMVAFGSSRLLVTHPWFGEDRGSVSRVNLDGSLDRSFGEDGTVQIAAATRWSVPATGRSWSRPQANPVDGGTERGASRLLPRREDRPSFGADGHADVHFGPFGTTRKRWRRRPMATSWSPGSWSSLPRPTETKPGSSGRAPEAERLAGPLIRQERREDASRSWGEIVAFDVTPTPSGGILVEGGNEIETFFWKLKRDGSIDRRFSRADIAKYAVGPNDTDTMKNCLSFPAIAMLPGGKFLLVATGFGPAVAAANTGRSRCDCGPTVALTIPMGGMAGRSAVEHAGRITLLPGGDLAVAASFEGKGATGHSFGAIVFGPDGQIDRRYGRGGRCRARLGGRHAAAGVALIGGRVIVGGEGTPGPWLLNCPLPDGNRFVSGSERPRTQVFASGIYRVADVSWRAPDRKAGLPESPQAVNPRATRTIEAEAIR